MDWESVSEEMLRRCPDLSWVGFQKEGVTIKIRVVPRDTAEELTTVPGHIVADKDGVVEEILVLQGKQCIETGKAVKAGDIIISGYVTYEDESGNETSPANLVHAKGIVRGTSWLSLIHISDDTMRTDVESKAAADTLICMNDGNVTGIFNSGATDL